MRLVVQRTKKAKVSVGKETVGEIDNGLFVLVGVKNGDTKSSADILAEKLSKLRVMADKKGKMNLSVRDVGGKILAVSQFTLYANTDKGNRPSLIEAAEPKLASEVYEYFVTKLRNLGVEVETGKFGAYMEIEASLDGPVTIVLEK